MICCSFVPANCPRMACVVAAGGCMVSWYMNMEEVVAIVTWWEAVQPQRFDVKLGKSASRRADIIVRLLVIPWASLSILEGKEAA